MPKGTRALILGLLAAGALVLGDFSQVDVP